MYVHIHIYTHREVVVGDRSSRQQAIVLGDGRQWAMEEE